MRRQVGALVRAGLALGLLLSSGAQAAEVGPHCGALVNALEAYFQAAPSAAKDKFYRLGTTTTSSNGNVAVGAVFFADLDTLLRTVAAEIPTAILVDEAQLDTPGLANAIAELRYVTPFFLLPKLRSAPISVEARARSMGFEEVLPPGPAVDTYLRVGVENFQDRQTIHRAAGLAFAERGVAAVSGSMLEVFALVRQAAKSAVPVLLSGPTGTGKEQLARALHDLSPRANGPLRFVNCSELRGETATSQLFGHEKGSFTGAAQNHKGLFQATTGGTLVLDEVQSLPLDVQEKLLRVLEVGTVRPHGSNDTVDVDVRIVAVTNESLKKLVAEGKFREDLYYRLAGTVIELEPLRHRREDIRIQAEHFLRLHQGAEITLTGFGPGVLEMFEVMDWPGNSRQFSNAIREAVVAKAGKPGKILEVRDLPRWVFAAYTEQFEGKAAAYAGDDGFMHIRYGGSMEHMLEQLRRMIITRAMRDSGGNQAKAAETLQIARTTLRTYNRGLDSGAE